MKKNKKNTNGVCCAFEVLLENYSFRGEKFTNKINNIINNYYPGLVFILTVLFFIDNCGSVMPVSVSGIL